VSKANGCSAIERATVRLSTWLERRAVTFLGRITATSAGSRNGDEEASRGCEGFSAIGEPFGKRCTMNARTYQE
jgi:hypothetical protein